LSLLQFITSIYEQETTQFQNNNFPKIHFDKQQKPDIKRAKNTFIKLDFEGNNNVHSTEQRLFNDSISSSASSTTSSAATASSTPDDDSFLEDEDGEWIKFKNVFRICKTTFYLKYFI
jgi:hypothetical protein